MLCRGDPNLRNEGIASIMSHARLVQIWKFFRIADPADPTGRLRRGEEGYDTKFHFRQLYEALQEKLLATFVAGGFVVMDEYMQGSAHRVKYKRVIKGKPKSHGLLWYVMCSAREFFNSEGELIVGATVYIPLCFALYTADEPWKRVPGPRGGRGYPPLEWRGFGEGGCFLLHFLAPLLARGVILKGTTIIGDRLFTSVRLLRRLAALGLHYIGTAKKNCKGVPTFRPTVQVRGTSMFRIVENIATLVIGWWRDSTWVLLMTLG
jgi:hypothetical protein